jgi:hypothetical protein
MKVGYKALRAHIMVQSSVPLQVEHALDVLFLNRLVQ